MCIKVNGINFDVMLAKRQAQLTLSSSGGKPAPVTLFSRVIELSCSVYLNTEDRLVLMV